MILQKGDLQRALLLLQARECSIIWVSLAEFQNCLKLSNELLYTDVIRHQKRAAKRDVEINSAPLIPIFYYYNSIFRNDSLAQQAPISLRAE